MARLAGRGRRRRYSSLSLPSPAQRFQDMPYIILSDASLAFGHVPLLDHADFQLDAGERVALIGRNGTGKSSLLAALAGCGGLDEGRVWLQPGLRIGYVPQEPPFACEQTVFEAVVAGMGEVSRLLSEYHAVSHALGEAGADQTGLLERMHALQTELEARQAWSFEAQAERVIQRFSLDADRLVGTLSGGQKKRLALAQALAVSPDLLLLDEPTNHLDVAAIEWLEEMLVHSTMTLVLITHDRRFLERVATRIVELDRGSLLSCPGSFGEYQARKEAMLHDEALANARFDKFLAQEEVWIRQGIKARRTRNEGRVLRLERLRRERLARRERQGKVDQAGHQGAADTQRRAGAAARTSATGAAGAPRTTGEGGTGARCRRPQRQAGGSARRGRQELCRQGGRARLLVPRAAWRQDRHHRAEWRRQDNAAAADPRRAGSRCGSRDPRHEGAGGVLRPVP